MIIVVDSIDKAGKSTFIKALSEKASIPIYSVNMVGDRNLFDQTITISQRANFDTIVEFIRMFPFIDFIMDRFAFSEIIYGERYRGQTAFNLNEIEEKLGHLVLWVYIDISSVELIDRFKKEEDTKVNISDATSLKTAYDYLFEKTNVPKIKISSMHNDEEVQKNIDLVENEIIKFHLELMENEVYEEPK